MKYHVSAFSGPENDSFARRSATDSRINIGIGTTAAQKWDVSVFVLSPEGQCDWDDFLAVGATAAPHPVAAARYWWPPDRESKLFWHKVQAGWSAR